MTDLGIRLKQARVARGISLRDIAAATKISVVALEALERSDYSRLPGGIFSRAFVRAYALAVGLDPEAAVNDFLADFARYEREAERNKKRPEISPDDLVFVERQRRALRTLRLVLFAVALLAVVAVGYFVFVWWPARNGTAGSAPRTLAAPASPGLGPFGPHLG